MEGILKPMNMCSCRHASARTGDACFFIHFVLRAMHGIWPTLLCRLGTGESKPSCCDLTRLKLRLKKSRIVSTEAERSFQAEKGTGALNSASKQEVDNLNKNNTNSV